MEAGALKPIGAIAIVLCYVSASYLPAQIHHSSKPPETPHLQFVTEYVRELAEIQEIRDDFDRQMDSTKNPNSLSVSSYSFTRMILELKSHTRVLGAMHLNKPYDVLIPSITELCKQKIALFERLLETDRKMLEGPKSGVDYSELAAEIPELRAKIDDVDHTLFNATPLVFMSLVDPRPDSHDQVSHLVITCAERTQLIDQINVSFGDKLNQKSQPYGVSTATVLRDALLKKGHKCSDEPWD